MIVKASTSEVSTSAVASDFFFFLFEGFNKEFERSCEVNCE